MDFLDNRQKMAQIENSQVEKRECRFAIWSPSVKPGDYTDMHLVKELVTTKDGDTYPNITLIKNFQRDFGVTKKAHRNHEEKKEFEDISKLKMYQTTQVDLNLTIAKALGEQGDRKSLRHGQLANSPYLYGSTIQSTTLIKQKYDARWADNRSTFTVGTLDFETDMVNRKRKDEVGDPIISSYVLFGKYFLVVDSNFVKEFPNPEASIRQYLDDHIMADFFTPRGITQSDIVIKFEDHPVKLIKRAATDFHKASPDICGIWNISFDFPMMLETCKRYGARPEDILSDPQVPREYRRAYYHWGQFEKEKAGKKQPVDPVDRWDNVYLTAGWHPTCGMRAYKKLRPTEPKGTYSLDAIAKKHLDNIGKFKPAGTEHMDGESFHVHMQTKEKIAYCAYALIDPALHYWIEEEVKDLAVKYPLQCYYSSLDTFASGPKKNEDEMYWDLRLQGKLQASTGSQMKTQWCDKLQTCNGWITLLEPHLCHPQLGTPVTDGAASATLTAIAAFDVDVEGAYPTTGIVTGLSKGTTRFEIIGYEHIDRQTQRQIGFHLSNPKTNAVELAKLVYSAPELLDVYDKYCLITGKSQSDTPAGWDEYFDDTLYREEIYGI